MKTYTQEQLNEIINQHSLWLNSDGGSRANLIDANLRGANLRGANLRGANLRGANLRGANLSDANLSDANLRGANLRGADPRGADLIDANLIGANLIGANLRGANLSDADLSDANLSDANLRGADLRGADLRGADLRGATGDLKCLKSIFLEEYQITYTSEILQIGCQKHRISEWWEFDDKRILEMDGKTALKFWRKYKDFIKMAIELSPAEPTGKDNE